jgi:hypothetical protein
MPGTGGLDFQKELAEARNEGNRSAESHKRKAPHMAGLWFVFVLAYAAFRESSDNPILNAFCRVAPSLRFRVRAMLAARLFFFASVFNVRTCAAVHARRFNFLTI